MIISGSGYVPDSGHDKKDGADVTATYSNLQAWWPNVSNWESPLNAWDFSNVWNDVDTTFGAEKLPTLRNMPAGVQDPKL